MQSEIRKGHKKLSKPSGYAELRHFHFCTEEMILRK